MKKEYSIISHDAKWKWLESALAVQAEFESAVFLAFYDL
jgi:hypothetical protein